MTNNISPGGQYYNNIELRYWSLTFCVQILSMNLFQ